MRRVVTVSLIACALLASGCADAGETTTTATAIGGGMGAGLGAIVGSTSGDAGAGMVIGGIAGAASGAAIGNILQEQEDAIRTQDEAMERQEQMIASQRSELNELRRLGQDSVSFRSTGSDPRAAYGARPSAPLRYEPRAAVTNTDALQQGSARLYSQQQYTQQQYPQQLNQPTQQIPQGYGRQPIREADIITAPQAQNPGPVKGAYDWDQGKNLPTTQEQNVEIAAVGTAGAAPAMSDNYGSPGNFENVQVQAERPIPQSYSITTPECNQAETEARQAESSEQTSDKLFHIRRALRLCPNEARYHNSLGQVYLSLNRTMDARFEFEQALALDPNLQAARDNLQSIGKKQG